MRLVCPNCDAQYEVDAAAIPEAGRDVQCSNCGHTWFQMPPDMEAEQEADRAIYGAVPDQDASVQAPAPSPSRGALQRPRPSLAPENTAQPAVPPPITAPAPPSAPPVPRRALDESLLTVLREEAERETAVRRAEIPRPLESQSDLGLEETSVASASSRAVRERLSRLRGQDPEPEVTERPTARRDLLPDIEEINSTLRASTENRSGPTGAIAGPTTQQGQHEARGGFRSGFTLILLVSVLALFAYVAAPRISEYIPGLKAPLASYVSQVDHARLWVDGIMQQATRGLQLLTGKTPG